MDTQELVAILAACIIRADHLDRQNRHYKETPLAGYTYEVYWYTREAVFEFLKRERGDKPIASTWGNVLISANNLKFLELEDVIKIIPDEIWLQVAHPDIIVQDILNS